MRRVLKVTPSGPESSQGMLVRRWQFLLVRTLAGRTSTACVRYYTPTHPCACLYRRTVRARGHERQKSGSRGS